MVSIWHRQSTRLPHHHTSPTAVVTSPTLGDLTHELASATLASLAVPSTSTLTHLFDPSVDRLRTEMVNTCSKSAPTSNATPHKYSSTTCLDNHMPKHLPAESVDTMHRVCGSRKLFRCLSPTPNDHCDRRSILLAPFPSLPLTCVVHVPTAALPLPSWSYHPPHLIGVKREWRCWSQQGINEG